MSGEALDRHRDQPLLAHHRPQLLQQPAYLAYVITFAIVGQVWLTHHNMWRYVAPVEQPLLLLNLLLLLFVAAIPFTASLLATNRRGSTADQRLTAALYVGTVLGEALFFNLSWWWARRRGLLRDDVDPRLARAVARRFLLGPVLYLVAFSFVFVNAVLSLCLYLLLVGLYLCRAPVTSRPPRSEQGEMATPDRWGASRPMCGTASPSPRGSCRRTCPARSQCHTPGPRTLHLA